MNLLQFRVRTFDTWPSHLMIYYLNGTMHFFWIWLLIVTHSLIVWLQTSMQYDSSLWPCYQIFMFMIFILLTLSSSSYFSTVDYEWRLFREGFHIHHHDHWWTFAWKISAWMPFRREWGSLSSSSSLSSLS